MTKATSGVAMTFAVYRSWAFCPSCGEARETEED